MSSSSVPVLVATGHQDVEERLLTAFAHPSARLRVARRCVDLADLLAAATTGVAPVVVVSTALRRFDRDAVARLRAAGVAVVAMAADEASADLLRAYGVAVVVPLDAAPAVVAQAVVDALDRPPGMHPAVGPAAVGPNSEAADGAPAVGDFGPHPGPPNVRQGADIDGGRVGALDGTSDGRTSGGAGQVIAVWGPPGAPGRTLVAASVAVECALAGLSTLLVDADVHAAALAQTLGLLDEVPGLAAAARAANTGTLDVASLAGYARAVEIERHSAAPLRVLTGLPRADRWPELRAASVGRVLELGREIAAVTVVDLASCVEGDDVSPYEGGAPARNAVTLEVLAAADRVLAVGAADPVGLARLVRGIGELGRAAPGVVPSVVVNRLRPGPILGDPRREVEAALLRFAGVRPVAFLPEERSAVDDAVARGRLLAEVAPRSALRLALLHLAADLADLPVPAHTRARRIRRLGRLLPQRSGRRRPRAPALTVGAAPTS